MADRPEDVDAAFAAIVADLEREGVGSRLPDLDDPAEDQPANPPVPPSATSQATADDPGAEPAPGRRPASWRGHDGEWDWTWGTDDEHYVPPEPPPLPRLRPLTIAALVLIVVSVVLLIVPGVVGLDARIGTPIALVALTFGGAMLLLRVRHSPKNQDPDTDRDDGAQI
ncbi:MAG: hypothetical protein GEV28_40845 [Actinophytocola sp.]|uniref:hypothetical protein n=1 Tax=Actinophytocola sp. TaxID=1872138 RepID=UPI001322FA05|nr:hypothetical protein [Actinophytocola sp.]MPZ86384.1 hypothetical protein [Actinophytocola sp.]